MKKIIELKRDGITRLANSEPFLVPDILELDFKPIGYSLAKAFITIKNGNIKETYKLSNPFKVDDKFLFAGEIHISVCLYDRDTLIKKWNVVPIKIREVDGTVQCTDYLAELENRLKDIELNYVTIDIYNELVDKINELAQKHNETEDIVKQIKENLKEN